MPERNGDTIIYRVALKRADHEALLAWCRESGVSNPTVILEALAAEGAQGARIKLEAAAEARGLAERGRQEILATIPPPTPLRYVTASQRDEARAQRELDRLMRLPVEQPRYETVRSQEAIDREVNARLRDQARAARDARKPDVVLEAPAPKPAPPARPAVAPRPVVAPRLPLAPVDYTATKRAYVSLAGKHDEIAALNALGYTDLEIAGHFGCNAQTVSKVRAKTLCLPRNPPVLNRPDPTA